MQKLLMLLVLLVLYRSSCFPNKFQNPCIEEVLLIFTKPSNPELKKLNELWLTKPNNLELTLGDLHRLIRATIKKIREIQLVLDTFPSYSIAKEKMKMAGKAWEFDLILLYMQAEEKHTYECLYATENQLSALLQNKTFLFHIIRRIYPMGHLSDLEDQKNDLKHEIYKNRLIRELITSAAENIKKSNLDLSEIDQTLLYSPAASQ